MPENPPSLTDFPSRISPMVVKELRQGLRTNMFTVAFILLQAFMVLCLLIGAANPGSSSAEGFFWFFITVSLLFIQPLRGFNALSSEFQLNTMDLIQLTRLNTWGITMGKWTALNAQSLLLFTGVLPYLVLRYFLGGVDFVKDLGTLGLMVLGSGLASAVTIGCSAFKSYLIRITLLIGAFVGFQILMVTGRVYFAFSGFGSWGWPSILLWVLSGIYGIFFFLSLGASRIASASENHSARKRLSAVLFAAVALCFALWGSPDAALIFSGVVLGLACVDALTENPPVFGAVLKPFSGNSITRLFAWIFTPGWHTGIAYFLLCSCLWGIAFYQLKVPGMEPAEAVIWVLGLAGTISFPLIWIHLFFRKALSTQMNFGFYLFAQACLALATILVSILTSAASSIADAVLACVPIPSVILVALSDHNSGVVQPYFLVALILALLLSVGIPAIRGREIYRQMRRSFQK